MTPMEELDHDCLSHQHQQRVAAARKERDLAAAALPFCSGELGRAHDANDYDGYLLARGYSRACYRRWLAADRALTKLLGKEQP